MELRLQKWLADAGIASRRKTEEMIAAGRVAVNGVIITRPGAKAETKADTLTLDGKIINPPSLRESVYIMLHKPEGVVTTVSDPLKRPTVMDYLPTGIPRIYPVGRLDYDSSGLLLLTNDGGLTHTLTHPRYGADKIYAARIRGVPTKETLQRLRSGIFIGRKKTAPCQVKIMRNRIKEKPQPNIHAKNPRMPNDRAEDACLLRITLREGQNRQVRKMCEAAGHPVISLKRIGMGTLKLGDLPRGQWRYLDTKEIESLKKRKG